MSRTKYELHLGGRGVQEHYYSPGDTQGFVDFEVAGGVHEFDSLQQALAVDLGDLNQEFQKENSHRFHDGDCHLESAKVYAPADQEGKMELIASKYLERSGWCEWEMENTHPQQDQHHQQDQDDIEMEM